MEKRKSENVIATLFIWLIAVAWFSFSLISTTTLSFAQEEEGILRIHDVNQDGIITGEEFFYGRDNGEGEKTIESLESQEEYNNLGQVEEKAAYDHDINQDGIITGEEFFYGRDSEEGEKTMPFNSRKSFVNFIFAQQ
jgi:hypothetical protein